MMCALLSLLFGPFGQRFNSCGMLTKADDEMRAVYDGSKVAADSADAIVPGGGAGICRLDFSSSQSIRFESYMALGDVEVLKFVILRPDWLQQSLATGCQRAATEQGPSLPRDGAHSPAGLQSARETLRVVGALVEGRAWIF